MDGGWRSWPQNIAFLSWKHPHKPSIIQQAGNAFSPRKAAPTQFRKFYERGDFPIALQHDAKGNKISWKVGLVVKPIHTHTSPIPPPTSHLQILSTKTQHMYLATKVEIEKLDYHHYLPLFFDGLCETKHPYNFFARRGIEDMLDHGGQKILPVIPQLIIPIKSRLGRGRSRGGGWSVTISSYGA